MNIPLNPTVRLRLLRASDAEALGAFFAGLSAETRRRYQPHPLTADFARELCGAASSTAWRLVIDRAGELVGYFILETRMSEHEAGRYRTQGIELASDRDWLFAPVVADACQNLGLASLAMPHLLRLAREQGARSLVLMGGTQATNARAIAFYGKFGFQRCGGYQTEVFNHDMRLRWETGLDPGR
jgi:GNAT superfamily N-acetyltransferase